MTLHLETPPAPGADAIAAVAAVLKRGGVALLPTDTIYGLHARAHDDSAVATIADIKGRDETKPFIVLAASLEQAESLGVTLQPGERETLTSIWPAPLTAILRLRTPIAASRGASTLAVRIPAVAWLRDLLERTGPLVSTSANRSGEAPLTDPKNLARELHDRLDAVIDAGPREGEPSAILDLTGEEPRLVREGERSFTQFVRKTLRKTR
jgi:L-threonylcarbamoyladenylate synthase